VAEQEPVGYQSLALRVIERIGVCGILPVLWTAVVCFALVRGDLAVVQYLWKDLLDVWLGLAGLAVVSVIVVGKATSREARNQPALVPRAKPPAADAPGTHTDS
jgi:hypothetical protein